MRRFVQAIQSVWRSHTWAVSAVGAVVAVGVVAVLATSGGSDEARVAASGGSGDDSVTSSTISAPASTTSEAATTTVSSAPSTSTSTTTSSAPPSRTEAEILEERGELNADVAAVQRYVHRLHYPSDDSEAARSGSISDYGGLEFDTESDPVRVVVTFGENREVHTAQLTPELAHPDRVDIRAVGDVDPDAVWEEVQRRVPDGATYGGGPSRFHAFVELRPGFDDVASEFFDRYGAQVRIRVGDFYYPIVAEYGYECRAVEDFRPGPDPDVTVEVRVDEGSWSVGDTVTGSFVVHNDGSESVEWDPDRERSNFTDPGTDAIRSETGRYYDRTAIGHVPISLPPGETSDPRPFTARTGACEPSPTSLMRPGTYELLITAGPGWGRAPVILDG